SAQKNGPQALGRSRGGLSIKVHTVAVSESQVLGVILSGGQEGDAPVGEEMLAEVLACKEIKAVGADRAYDSDRIRALLAVAGKEAVIPPRSNRTNPPAYDQEKYKVRNKVERLFNRLKSYRAVATRYDKLAAMFLGGVLATLLAVSLKCIVNTP
ncbi:MAG: IS5 family transposase, partial [Rhodospirillales bacterium]|nr:IS5 family transposase [Acetobacter sp.]